MECDLKFCVSNELADSVHTADLGTSLTRSFGTALSVGFGPVFVEGKSVWLSEVLGGATSSSFWEVEEEG